MNYCTPSIMKRLTTAACLALFLAPALCLAQSPFDGTWKIDPAKVTAPKKPFKRVLKDGIYRCITCTPPYSVKADGAFHPVKGDPGTDMEAIKVVNDHEIRFTDKKDGKVVSHGTITVAPDNQTQTIDITDITKGGPVTYNATAMRVARGPAGSHAVSGSWRIKSYNHASEKALMTTFRVTGDTLHMSQPTGESFTAKMDGRDAPYKGSDTITSVAVTRMGPRKLHTLYKYQGKPVSEETMTVSPDGRTLHVVEHNKKSGTTMRFVAGKQSGTDDSASATTAGGRPIAGIYTASANGRTRLFTFTKDGAYTARENGKVAETGTWTSGNHKVCLHPESSATRCYRETDPGADGTWKAIRIGHPEQVSVIRRKD